MIVYTFGFNMMYTEFNDRSIEKPTLWKHSKTGL